ncbi:hypothetical protein NW759_016976 [Fusarium solani]|nr:hypothetical protein NW759_016976 [Fusarium solani]
MNFPFPAIDDPRRKPNLGRRTAFSTELSYMCEAPKNTSLQSMGSQPSIDATGGFSSPTSTAARSHSQPSMASLEAHFHPPDAAISPQDVQGIQDPTAHLLDMQPYLSTPPSENVAPPWHEGLFNAPKGQFFMTLPGSGDRISVPIDVQKSTMQETRNQNAASSRRHREKKKKQQEQLSEVVKQLQVEMKGMEERMWKMEKEQNSCREFIGNLIMQAPWLSHSVQAPDFLPQTSNTVIRMDDFAARPQSYEGGSSPGEQLSKRRRTNQSPRVLDTRVRSFRQSTHRYRV